jgi:hypothetical protein
MTHLRPLKTAPQAFGLVNPKISSYDDVSRETSSIILGIIMITRETLILKSLQFKELHSCGSCMGGALVDHLLEQNPEKADELTKNVCARIPLQLAQDMETIGGMLELNKREIITMALHDFLDKANSVIDEFDALPEGGV